MGTKQIAMDFNRTIQSLITVFFLTIIGIYFFRDYAAELVLLAAIVVAYLFYTYHEFIQGQTSQLKRQFNEQIQKAQNAIIDTESTQQTILENLPIGVLVVSHKGTILYANHYYQKSIQSSIQIGHTYEQLSKGPHDIFKVIRESFLFEKAGEKLVFIENKVFQLIISTIRRDERFKGILVSLTDVTDVKRLERIQKDFIADVTHELKTPLTAILGVSDILNREGIENRWNEVKPIVDILAKESLRMHRIVLDLLELSKLGASHYKINPTLFLLPEILLEVQTLFGEEISKKGLFMEVITKGDTSIYADRERIKQVLINLVSNAIRYTQQGGITISIEKEVDFITIKIKDTGIGIAKDHQDRIFERFYRVDPARSRETGGTGIGLAIAKGIIEAHQGDIHFISEVGQGTEFIIRLPLHA